jgi:hypothetical protein
VTRRKIHIEPGYDRAKEKAKDEMELNDLISGLEDISTRESVSGLVRLRSSSPALSRICVVSAPLADAQRAGRLAAKDGGSVRGAAGSAL